jgi:hypothetical protein
LWYGAWFCSELDAAQLPRGGLIATDHNPYHTLLNELGVLMQNATGFEVQPHMRSKNSLHLRPSIFGRLH